MAELYCTKCTEKINYIGEGVHACPKCGAENYFPLADTEKLELYSKAQWYWCDGQYFNALKMYDIILKADEGEFCACFGALLAEFGARYADCHDGTYRFVCERTHSHSVYESEYYQKLTAIAPAEAMQIFTPVLAEIEKEQKKNNELYLATAPVDEKKDYRREARESEEELADDYLSAREKYLQKEREEQEEAQRRRLEAKQREEAAQKARENRAALAAKKEKRKKTAIAVVSAVVFVVVCTVLVFSLIIPSVHLSTAKKAISDGRYDDAARSLRSADGFGDSEVLLSKYCLYGLSSGDAVRFGNYEQDANEQNGKEPIDWIVLESTDEKVTLISGYVLDCVMYHENKDAPAYWKTASLRAWLDGEFAATAFSESESRMLVTVNNENPDNDRCGTKGGEATEDRVYLLSIDEAQKYLEEEQRVGVPTQYAVERGVYTKTEYAGTYWWLRSPGSTQNSAAKVNGDGNIDIRGSGVNYSSYGVRPVITLQKAPIE